jgi:hypothetical protein
LIDESWHSSVIDVLSFRGADCDTDHHLVVAKIREKLPVSKQAAPKFNLKKLNDVEVKEHYQVKSEIGLQLWKTLMMMMPRTSIGLGKILGIYKSLSHRESRLS